MSLIPLKSPERHPLCVDMDGSLIRSDTLVEASFSLVRENILFLLLIPIWLLRGRLYFKNTVFQHSKLDPKLLPYNEEVLALIREQQKAGRPIVLATASTFKMAEAVAEYLGLFTQVLASDDRINLKGSRKADLLVERFGAKGFDYVGNSADDLKVWQSAQRSYMVEPKPTWELAARKNKQDVVTIGSRGTIFSLLIRQMRIHQWAKNILVFLPMFIANRSADAELWIASFQAFFAFSFFASSIYVVNDLLDLEADRQHPDKQRRPFASGKLSLLWSILLFPSLVALGLLVSSQLPGSFRGVLGAYIILTTLYSFKLKQMAIADILLLAGLYSWRVVAGSVACGIALSEWFISFAIFFFLSLALVKRCSELIDLANRGHEKGERRGYLVSDIPLLVSFGVSSAYLSILVLALYISTPEVNAYHSNPKLLWGVLPPLFYWISRIWLKSYRGELPSDPLVFAIKDGLSYLVILSIGAVWLASQGL